IWYLFTSLDQSQYFTVIDGFVLKKLAFSQWIDAESVIIAKKNSGNILERISIPKEILIRRVANILGGSHPEGMESNLNKNDSAVSIKFDPAVKYLMEYEVIGRQLPYFILLKIARDILDVF